MALLERQKAAAIAALESSENQLLELEREANSQLDELQVRAFLSEFVINALNPD